MSIIIKGGNSIKEANTIASIGEFSGLTVNSSTAITHDFGYSVMAGEVDAGDVIGERTVRNLYVTQDFRLNRNLESPMWDDVFCSSVLNNAKYFASANTQTITVGGGFLNLNAGNSVAAGTAAMVRTYRTFSYKLSSPTYVNIKAKFSETLQNRSITEFGMGLAVGALAPTDGAFFRASGGTLNAVVIKNGFETFDLNVHTPLSGVVYDYLLAITDTDVEFWVDDVIVSRITPVAVTGGTSLPNALPLFARNYNSGGTVPSAIQFNISRWDVLFGDLKMNKNWRTKMVTNGQSSISTPDGQPSVITGTTSANLVNSSATTVVIATNTTAGYATMGGDFAMVASAGTEDDYAIFAYLNPAGSATIAAKTFVIQNVYISTWNSGATIGATGNILQWSLGIGGTSASLAEVDSLDLGTRASRRIALGCQSFSASTTEGTMGTPTIVFEPGLATPLMVEAGTYCHVILKIPVGTATSNLLYRGMVTINGYYD